MNPNPNVEQDYNQVLSRIFAQTKHFPAMLNQVFSSVKNIPVKLTYIIGNHDRAITNFASLKTAITQELGYPVHFDNILNELPYGTYARHGHEWDENCSAYVLLKEVLQPNQKWDQLDVSINNWMAIGEVITAELMGGLAYYVRQQDPVLADIIQDVNNVRPMEDVFSWLETTARNFNATQQKFLAQALIQAISGVVDSDFGKLWDNVKNDWVVSGDITDYLEKVRAELQANGYAGLRSLAARLIGWRDMLGLADDKDEYLEGAVHQFEKSVSPEIRYILYGHTHKARHDFISTRAGRPQIYINTGTYLPLIESTETKRGFIGADQFTMVFVYSGAEIGTTVPQLDLWNGIRQCG